MTTRQLRYLAVGCFALALALLIPYLAMREDYTMYRDGARVSATVTEVVARKKGTYATVRYHHDGRDHDHRIRVPAGEPAITPGATVELRMRGSRGSAILASAVEAERPSLLWLALAAPWLPLGIWVWLAPRRARARRARWRDPLDPIVDGVRRTRNMTFGLGAFMLVAGPLIAIAPSYDAEATTGTLRALQLLGGVSIAVAILCAVLGYRLRDPRRNHVIDLIVNRPHDIAWFYVEETEGKYGSGKTRAVHVWTTAKKKVVISVVPEDMDAILAELARRAPHAAQGFDRETYRMYKQDPRRWTPARTV